MEAKELRDKISGETLEELMPRLKIFVEWGDSPTHIPGYCCSTQEGVFQSVVDYIAGQLHVDPDKRHSIRFDETNDGWELDDLLEQIQYNNAPTDSVYLIDITGLESFKVFRPHWYDQTMVEYIPRRLKENSPTNPKKIVIISNISNTRGEEKYAAYRDTARTASGFKKFIWEF